MIKKLNTFIAQHSLKTLLIYAILIRVILYVFYQGVTIYPDSENYIDLANYLSQFNLNNYTGERTPGFPTLIAFANNSLQLTIAIQLILGVLSTYFIYSFSKQNTKNTILAFWIAITYTSFLHVLFFEFAILTEALSIFLVILSFWYIQTFKLLEKNTSLKHYFILSIIFSWMYFTRPMLIYFPLGFFIFYAVKQFSFKALGKGITIIVLPFLCYYAWNSLNKKNIGYFTNTYYLGINITQTATPFFDKVPEQDALYRDVFVKHRDSIVKHNPEKYPMTVWYAYNELLATTSLKPQDLTNEFARISKNLFKAHPDLYLKQVGKSWLLFWNTPRVFWNKPNFSSNYFKAACVIVWTRLQQYVVLLFNILFLIFATTTILQFFKTKCKVYTMHLFLVCIVLSGSLAQAIVTFGSNSRFSFPFFALIVYFVLSKLNVINRNYFSLKK